mgnify:CR=1 FL=1
MDTGKLKDRFGKIPEQFEDIIEAYIEYYKAVVYEKLVIAISGSSTLIILAFLLFIGIHFLSIGAALLFGYLLSNYILGFVIVGGLYFLMAILVYLMRNSWIVNPVVRAFRTIIYTEDGIFDTIVSSENNEADEK